MSNIQALKPEYRSMDGMRERIRARATALLGMFGEDGRKVLTRFEVNQLVTFIAESRPATASDYRVFTRIERDLQVKHGPQSWHRIASGDGRVLARAGLPKPRSAVAAQPTTVVGSEVKERRCPCCGLAGGVFAENAMTRDLPANVRRLVVRNVLDRGPNRAA